MATKLDYAREARELYRPGREPGFIDVPEFVFLMVDGRGDPNAAVEYRQAIEALYAVSYTLKFALRREPFGLDYRVLPLEGLWWTADMASFSTAPKDAWEWTTMIRQPDAVDEELVSTAIGAACAKRELPAARLLRLVRFHEGRAAQVMHIGPYADEGPTIERLHAFIREHGCELAGKHHEIYLGDPRRSAPEKLKTIIRQPVL